MFNALTVSVYCYNVFFKEEQVDYYVLSERFRSCPYHLVFSQNRSLQCIYTTVHSYLHSDRDFSLCDQGLQDGPLQDSNLHGGLLFHSECEPTDPKSGFIQIQMSNFNQFEFMAHNEL